MVQIENEAEQIYSWSTKCKYLYTDYNSNNQSFGLVSNSFIM